MGKKQSGSDQDLPGAQSVGAEKGPEKGRLTDSREPVI